MGAARIPPTTSASPANSGARERRDGASATVRTVRAAGGGAGRAGGIGVVAAIDATSGALVAPRPTGGRGTGTGLSGTFISGCRIAPIFASSMICVRTATSCVGEIAPKAMTASSSVAKRCAGSLAIMRPTQASSSVGTSGRTSRTFGTGSNRCPRITSATVSPVYGCVPVSSS